MHRLRRQGVVARPRYLIDLYPSGGFFSTISTGMLLPRVFKARTEDPEGVACQGSHKKVITEQEMRRREGGGTS
jgi:hypothetical protein